MALKKSELYSSIWKSCDELRGGMDASQYKDYVLVLLFVKYVSDKYAGQKDAVVEIPKGGSFSDMLALKGDKEIGDKINKIIAKLAKANNLTGVIDVADFNDETKLGKGKDMVERLSNLVSIFGNPSLDFRSNRADGDDLLGDAYEYLMRHFATESGKSKGQFYTPSEVSRIMARVLGIAGAKKSNQTIYDPTCGSGSLLLKAHDEALERTGANLTIYGQERDNATAALAKMNMWLHSCPSAEIERENSLSTPLFKDGNSRLKTFDFVVANPPFSDKAWSNGIDAPNDEFKRFELGVPPTKNGDYAFLLHILASLKTSGKGACILPHGVLFRGNAEADIRKNIIIRGYIKGIIGLPANLFYGTGIPACILVLDKQDAAERKSIFMIDASKGFVKDGNKNRLRAQDIHKIVDVFTNQLEIPKFSRMVPFSEIEKNEFNLNIPRYIDSSEAEDLQDIDAHLRGGIPNADIDALETYWKVFPAVRSTLFQKANRAGYSELKVDASDIKETIFGHKEFTAFNDGVHDLFVSWKQEQTATLKKIKVADRPKALIDSLSESLLEHFEKAPLLDAYDVYQHLMTYWAETMQDDVYMIALDGWIKAAEPRRILEDKANKSKETADFTVGKTKFKTELIPPALLIKRYFSAEEKQIDALQVEADSIAQNLEQLKEENTGDDGLLEAVQEEGKILKGAVIVRLKALKGEKDAKDEIALLTQYLELTEQETEAKNQVKEAEQELEAKIAAKYGKLNEAEIKTLVVEDKWLGSITADVQSELDRVSQTLTRRVKELVERYSVPLPKLVEEVATLSARVDEHLKQMGAQWN